MRFFPFIQKIGSTFWLFYQFDLSSTSREDFNKISTIYLQTSDLSIFQKLFGAQCYSKTNDHECLLNRQLIRFASIAPVFQHSLIVIMPRSTARELIVALDLDSEN
jgi:hypothetical protein